MKKAKRTYAGLEKRKDGRMSLSNGGTQDELTKQDFFRPAGR